MGLMEVSLFETYYLLNVKLVVSEYENYIGSLVLFVSNGTAKTMLVTQALLHRG